jgi:hypothetical protein
MTQQTTQIPVSSIILDETIYPRKGIDHRRVGIFSENIRDGFEFDPIEVEPCPERPGFSRLLDGAHRWSAFKATGAETVFVIVRDLARTSFQYHLPKMAVLPNSANGDLSQGFTVAQVAEKHGWSEPQVWSLALEGKNDHDRFKELGWGFRTWDQWEFNDCDYRFGEDWPGRIPAQLVAHILRYFSQPGDLVLDPMAGGGVTPDTCLAMGRRCWAFDMKDRPDTRPEIEPFTWDVSSAQSRLWPVSAKEKPDLILFDPPYFDKKAAFS